MSCVAGDMPSRIGRWAEVMQIPSRGATSCAPSVSGRAVSGSNSAMGSRFRSSRTRSVVREPRDPCHRPSVRGIEFEHRAAHGDRGYTPPGKPEHRAEKVLRRPPPAGLFGNWNGVDDARLRNFVDARMRETVVRGPEAVSLTMQGTSNLPRSLKAESSQPAMFGVLLERLMTDTIGMGREERMRRLLRDVFGEARGPEVARQYRRRARCGRLQTSGIAGLGGSRG